MSGRLAGRIALITGASRGIGAAVARNFAAEGAHVVLAARTVGGLEELDDAIRAAGGAATLVPVDLRDFIKIDELAARLFDRYGRLDILVGNAAEFGVFSPLGHIDPAVWAEVIDLNLTANWRLIRAMRLLVDENDDLKVPGLRRGGQPTNEDEALIARLATTFDEQRHLDIMGARRFKYPLRGADLIRKYYFSPTIHITEISTAPAR